MAKRSQRSEKSGCLCGREPTGFMICCDMCDTWYHVRCVGLTKNASNSLDEWFCKTCSGIRSLLEEKHHDIRAKIAKIETNIDRLQASVDLSSKKVDSEILKMNLALNETKNASALMNNNCRQLKDHNLEEEKDELLLKIRSFEKQVCELENSLATSRRTYEDALRQQGQAKELHDSLLQEKEESSQELIQLRQENLELKLALKQMKGKASIMTFDLENIRKEKETDLSERDHLRAQLETISREKEIIILEMEKLKGQVQDCSHVVIENAKLKETLDKVKKRSKLSLGSNRKIPDLEGLDK